MAENYIDKWNANGQEYDIQDAGRGLPLGVATLDNNGRVPYEQLPESAVEFKGYWNANTNTPTLADGTGTKGDMYYVDVAGSQNLGSGVQYFNVGDRVLYDGSIWKNINSTTVKSVNSVMPNAQGNVALPTKVISIDSTLTVTGAPSISAGDTVKALFTADITGTDNTTGMSVSYNGASYDVVVPKEGALSDFVATELTTGNFTYIDAYKYVEFMLNGNDQFVIIENPIVLSGKGYKVHADGEVEEGSVGDIKSTMESTAPYGWLNLCADTAGRTVSKIKYSKLLTWATDAGLYGSGKPFNDATDTDYFIIPDLRELSLKGIGLTSKSTSHYDADGLSIGEFIDDRIKSHNHGLTVVREGSAGSYYDYQGSNMAFPGITGGTTVWKNYATGGSGSATNEVKSIGVNYFIKAL